MVYVVVKKTVNFDGGRLVLYMWGVSLLCVMISCYTTLSSYQLFVQLE